MLAIHFVLRVWHHVVSGFGMNGVNTLLKV